MMQLCTVNMAHGDEAYTLKITKRDKDMRHSPQGGPSSPQHTQGATAMHKEAPTHGTARTSDQESTQGRLKGGEKRGSEIYHEKQQLLRCGLHAVNALLQREAYTACSMDALADRLVQGRRVPWRHPHRSVLGLGDYDVNVLMCALQEVGMRAEWVGEEVGVRVEEGIVGFLVNVAAGWRWAGVLRRLLEERRHWMAVVRDGEAGFYLVNSDNEGAEWIGGEREVVEYLEGVREDGGHVLRVVRPRGGGGRKGTTGNDGDGLTG